MLHLLQMIEEMSSPIHNHYRFASPRHAQSTLESKESGMLNKPDEQGSTNILMDDLQPQPLAAAMYSLQFVADVVNRVQTALHQRTSQKPKNASMTQINFKSSDEPSFCYFFVDMQPQSGNDYPYSQYGMESCQDQKNISDKHLSTTPLSVETDLFELQRQRSISECSDDSFICFEHDSNDIESDSFECTDLNAIIKMPDINIDIQEKKKKVRFNLKPEIHVMRAWDFAYRAARKSAWQELARDRDRFQLRIKRVAPILNIILSTNHREIIYKDRFLDAK